MNFNSHFKTDFGDSKTLNDDEPEEEEEADEGDDRNSLFGEDERP